jgi:predicted LPLAT superfamily acyltransferase
MTADDLNLSMVEIVRAIAQVHGADEISPLIDAEHVAQTKSLVAYLPIDENGEIEFPRKAMFN